MAITPLKETLDILSNRDIRLFDGVYSHQGFEFYDPELDELNTGITGIDGTTQQIFLLRVEPQSGYDAGRYYNVEVSYPKKAEGSAVVSADLLLDFLVRAKLIINDYDEIFLNYVPDYKQLG